MIRLREAVVVEGRYDKIKLSSLLDALIIPTHGYRIFKDKAALAALRALARERGLIILTDSDAAGFRIRRHLQGAIPAEQLRHVYLPQMAGREPRKAKPSAEGLLGVEGVPNAVLLEALERAGVRPVDAEPPPPVGGEPLTKSDFVALGLSGAADSGRRRRLLLERLELPAYLSANAMLALVNATVGRAAFEALVRELFPCP